MYSCGVDLQTRLALYRTRLAERRTAISELQLGLLMITLPLTLHAGLMILVERHALPTGVASWLPLWALLLILTLAGIALTTHAMRSLIRTAAQLAALRESLEHVIAREREP